MDTGAVLTFTTAKQPQKTKDSQQPAAFLPPTDAQAAATGGAVAPSSLAALRPESMHQRRQDSAGATCLNEVHQVHRSVEPDHEGCGWMHQCIPQTVLGSPDA